MGKEDDLHAAVGLICEAVLDDKLWPEALTTLADVVGVAQIAFGAYDHRINAFDAIGPRVEPVFLASYRDYWAFHDPIWPRLAAQPTGQQFSLDSLIPRDDFAATAVYNEWNRPAKFGLSVMLAKLPADDQCSATIFAANPPDKEEIGTEQALAFKAALPHVNNAVRVHRLVRTVDLDHDTAPEKLEHMGFGVILVDAAAKVLFVNAWARALLTPGSGLALRGGYLCGTGRAATLQHVIASCAGRLRAPNGFGGEIALRRDKSRPLRVTVTPLRARGNVAELPWLGLRLPAAMVTISNPAMEKSLN